MAASGSAVHFVHTEPTPVLGLLFLLFVSLWIWRAWRILFMSSTWLWSTLLNWTNKNEFYFTTCRRDFTYKRSAGILRLRDDSSFLMVSFKASVAKLPGFLECFWVWAIESPSDWNSASPKCYAKSCLPQPVFLSSSPPFLSNSPFFPSFLLLVFLASTDIYWVLVMSISVLSGSEIVVSRTDIFHLLLNLQCFWWCRQNLTGMPCDEWVERPSRLIPWIMEPRVSPFKSEVPETTTNVKQTKKFSLCGLHLDVPSVCGWVFGEDNQQVNSEFSEKTKPDDEIVTWQEIGGGKFPL